MNYLDLLPNSKREKPGLSAVAEHQGTALLYLVDAEAGLETGYEALRRLSKSLANRSEPAWLGWFVPAPWRSIRSASRKNGQASLLM